MTIRILLVDDHPIVRQGLKTLLEGHSGWEVIGEASDGAEAVEKAKDFKSYWHDEKYRLCIQFLPIHSQDGL